MKPLKDYLSSVIPTKDDQEIPAEPKSPAVQLMTVGIFILTLLGAFFAGFFPVRSSNDPWWHIKTGQYLWNYFLEHGFLVFPPYDVFTYTGATTPWVNHEWLSQLVFFWAYAAGGLFGAITLKSVILMLTIWLLILYMYRNGVGWKIACFGSILVLLASQYSLYLRPPVFTYFFIVVFLHIILCFQLGEHFKKAFVAAVVCEIIWINLHGGAIIGIILVGFWWVSELWFCFITWLKENPTAPSFHRFGQSSLVLFAVSIASLINPFTYHIHLLPFKVSGDWFLIRNIGELQTPDMHIHNEFELIILALFLLPMLRAGSIWIYEGLAIIFFGSQALNHLRHIPLFALVAVPPLMSALAEERRTLLPTKVPTELGRTIWEKLNYWLRWALAYHVDVIIALLIVAYIFGLRPGKIWLRNYQDLNYLFADGYVKSSYPESAVNFLIRNNVPGPMYNHDNFAGYLIYRLSPDIMKIYTDSRYDLWGSQYAKEEMAVFSARENPLGGYDVNGNWFPIDRIMNRDGDIRNIEFFPELQAWKESGDPYWQFVLDKYDVNFIISYEGYPIDRYLRQAFQDWFLIYDDVLKYRQHGGYVIYLRNTNENLDLIQDYALLHRDKIPGNETGNETGSDPPQD